MRKLLLVGTALLAGQVSAQDLMLFPPETFGQVVAPQTESLLGDIQLEAQVGDYNNEFVANYGPESVFARTGRAVGMLQVLTNVGHAPCTAFLVEGNMLVTNHHCVPGILDNPKMKAQGAEFIAAVQFHAGFLHDGIEEGVQSFHVNPVPVETSKELDYTVLRVLGDANAAFGALELTAAVPLDHTPFWVIGHPMGEAQRISREKCQAASPAVVGNRLHHLCDTLPGNSGSPVIDADSKQVVALHHAGSRAGQKNYAVPMADILAQSKVLKAATSEAKEGDRLARLQQELDRLRKAQEDARAAEAERQRLADELAAMQAERDKLAKDKLAREQAEAERLAREAEAVRQAEKDRPDPAPAPKDKAEVPVAERGWLGVRIQDVTEEMVDVLGLEEVKGALVADVPDGPAKDGGILSGDVILTFGGVTVEGTRGLVAMVGEQKAGATVPVTLFRDGKEVTLRVTLGRRTAAAPAPKPESRPDAEAEVVTAEKTLLGMTLTEIGPRQRAEFELPEGTQGLFVLNVTEGSDAAEKGLASGDLLEELSQKPVNSIAAAEATIAEARQQGRKSILALVRRDGDLRFVALPL